MMKNLVFLMLCLSFPCFAEGIKVTDIVVKKTQFQAKMITIDKKSNFNFSVINVPKQKEKDNIHNYWDPGKHRLMINGGYFNKDFSSTGYYKVDGSVFNNRINKGLSGFVAIDKHGTIKLLTRKDDIQGYPTVVQSGPYVIDPGGKIGIYSNNKKVSRRTLIGETKGGDLVILITSPITLFEFAQIIKKKLPNIERLLNLDGGPSTALKTEKLNVTNLMPVKNYIFKKKGQGSISKNRRIKAR